MSDQTDLVDAQVKAFQGRDLDGFLACYAADAVIKDGDGNVMMSGIESIGGMYGQLFRQSPDLAVSIRTQMAIGEYVIHEEQIDGFNLAGYPPQVHAVVVYRVSEGRIREVTLLM